MHYNLIRAKTFFLPGLFLLLLFMQTRISLANETDKNITSETGLYYTIQKGDTLSDLSQKFYDSNLVWPDLWYQNNEIFNPHLIYPGEKIKLFKKAETDNIKIVKKNKTPVPVPQYKYYHFSKIDSIGFLKIEKKKERGQYNFKNYKNFDKPYIYKVNKNKKLISKGDLVYIKQQNGKPLSIGSLHSIYKTKLRLSKKTNKYIGTEYIVLGVIEISYENLKNYYEARVIKNFKDIEKYSFLMPYQQKSSAIAIPINQIEKKKNISGKIIAAAGNPILFGEKMIAFIDKGQNEGVMIGHKFTIYKQPVAYDPDTEEKINLSPISYGNILVIRTFKNTSTVIITKSKDFMQQGAMFSSVI
jgi:LysM repeat protein